MKSKKGFAILIPFLTWIMIIGFIAIFIISFGVTKSFSTALLIAIAGLIIFLVARIYIVLFILILIGYFIIKLKFGI